MKNIFEINTDLLKTENELNFDEKLSFDFLDINEKELIMNSDVFVKGSFYLADNFLVIHLFAKTKYQKPCIICNDFTIQDLCDEFYHSVPLEEIKDGIYDFKEELRNSLLLKIPQFVECNEGNCLQRKNLDKYINVNENSEEYFPFMTLK
jgi:hypothetical protein